MLHTCWCCRCLCAGLGATPTKPSALLFWLGCRARRSSSSRVGLRLLFLAPYIEDRKQVGLCWLITGKFQVPAAAAANKVKTKNESSPHSCPFTSRPLEMKQSNKVPVHNNKQHAPGSGSCGLASQADSTFSKLSSFQLEGTQPRFTRTAPFLYIKGGADHRRYIKC
jgi:hypothetical protein